MSLFNCNCRCTTVALIASVIVGVITAFLQITGMITVTPAFLWISLGIAVGYLGILVMSSALAKSENGCSCVCSRLNALLIGILGTILFALVLLAVGIVATSIVSAILVGLLLLFLTLIFTSSACLVRCYVGCSR